MATESPSVSELAQFSQLNYRFENSLPQIYLNEKGFKTFLKEKTEIFG